MNQKQAEDLAFRTAIDEATRRADAAGDKWVAEHTQPIWGVHDGSGKLVGTMLDLCGIVYIKFRDKRSKFYRWCLKNGYSSGNSLGIPHKYRMRQEQGLQEACDYAAVFYLHEVGIKGLTVYSRTD